MPRKDRASFFESIPKLEEESQNWVGPVRVSYFY